MRSLPDAVGATSPGFKVWHSSKMTTLPARLCSFRQRPVVRRGNVVEAMLEDGNLTISVKVEALEDGIPGQLVRVRNLRTQREFRGKVKNEQTVLVQM